MPKSRVELVDTVPDGATITGYLPHASGKGLTKEQAIKEYESFVQRTGWQIAAWPIFVNDNRGGFTVSVQADLVEVPRR